MIHNISDSFAAFNIVKQHQQIKMDFAFIEVCNSSLIDFLLKQ